MGIAAEPRCSLLRQPGICLLAAGALLAMAGCSAPERATQKTLRGSDLYVRGALAYQEGDHGRALSALQSAIADNPDLIMARFLLGTIYRERGEYETAAEHYQRVAALDPYVASNHFNLGLVYHLLNRLQEAATSYLRAIRLNPEDVKSNTNLAVVYTALGNAAQGLPYAQRAVELSPQSAEAHTHLAVVLDALGHYAEAEGAYRQALELDPDRTLVAVNLAGNLAAQQRYREAIRVYEQVLQKTDSSLIRQRYGYALLQAGRHDEAIREFNEALKLNVRNYQALNGLGDALLAQYRQSAMLDEKKRAEAVSVWKQSLEINPEQPRVAALVREYTDLNLFP